MKKVIIILCLLWSVAQAQTPTGVKTRFPGIWFQSKDTAAMTAADSLAMLWQRSDSSLYVRNYGVWRKVALGNPMVYPGAGIPLSTGSAWGTSYGTTGSGLVALNTSPSLSSPIIDGSNPYISFRNGSAVSLAAGRMWYDSLAGSWNLGMGNGNITQQVGEETFWYGKASSAISDSPLQIVKQSGTVGSSGVIQFAPATAGLTDGQDIIGVATESIATNGFGRVTTFGVVHNVTTNGTAYGETWLDGDIIWYNPATGNPTKVKPSAPGIKVSVGKVIKAGSGGSGSFAVEIDHGSILGGTDANVQFGTLRANDLIVYDSTLGYWKNNSISTLGIMKYTDTSGMLSNYIRTANYGTIKTGQALGVDTFLMATRPRVQKGIDSLGGLKFNISDTALVGGTNYYNKTAVDSKLGLKLNISDTSTMLSSYYNKTATDAKLALKLNISDTSTMLSPYSRDFNVVHKTGNESIAGVKTFTNNPIISYTSPLLTIVPTTNTDTATFRINEDGNYGGYMKLDANGNKYIFGYRVAGTDQDAFYINQNATPSVNINNLLSIGTSSPTTVSNTGITFAASSSINHTSGAGLRFSPYGASNAVSIYQNTGDLLIGTTTDAGYKLDVNGTARVQGNTTVTGNILLSTSGSGVNASGATTAIVNYGANGAGSGFTYSLNNAYGNISGTKNLVSIGDAFYSTVNQAANTGTVNWLSIYPVINATAGTLTTRGIYYNPTLTSLTNATHIAIETVTGNTLFGTTSGETVIGSSTTSGAKLTTNGSITASSAIARGVYFNNTLVAAANNDVLVGLDINPTFTNGAFTGVGNYALRAQNTVVATANSSTGIGIGINPNATGNSISRFLRTASTNYATLEFGNGTVSSSSQTWALGLRETSDNNFHIYDIGTSADVLRIFYTTGNFGINQLTDAGYKLDINGTARVQGALTGTSAAFSGTVQAANYRGTTYPYNTTFGDGTDASYTQLYAGSTAGSVSGVYVQGGGASSPNTVTIKTASVDRLTISATGAATFSSSIKTGIPTGWSSAGNWKFGSAFSTTVALNTTGYLTVEIDGTLYYLALASPL